MTMLVKVFLLRSTRLILSWKSSKRY